MWTGFSTTEFTNDFVWQSCYHACVLWVGTYPVSGINSVFSCCQKGWWGPSFLVLSFDLSLVNTVPLMTWNNGTSLEQPYRKFTISNGNDHPSPLSSFRNLRPGVERVGHDDIYDDFIIHLQIWTSFQRVATNNVLSRIVYGAYSWFKDEALTSNEDFHWRLPELAVDLALAAVSALVAPTESLHIQLPAPSALLIDWHNPWRKRKRYKHKNWINQSLDERQLKYCCCILLLLLFSIPVVAIFIVESHWHMTFISVMEAIGP